MTESEAHRRYEFRRQLEELRSKKGRGTELISIYIPHDKQISDVVAQLRDEHGQAANIKSKITRTNVQSALESLMSRLRYIPRSPQNGIVLFTGAIDVGSNKTDLQSFTVEPAEPFVSYKYHCDSAFYLNPLEDMLADKMTYGLLVLDRREATVGLLKGKRIELSNHLTSNVPGKQRKGGQSAHRFQQLRLIAIHEFYKRIGDAASKVFMTVDAKDFEAVLIGGPSPTKEEFDDGEYLHHELEKKKLGLFDTSYTDESGLYELVDNASDALMNLDVIKEKKVIEKFLKELVNDSGRGSYGEEEVRDNLKMGAVEVLLLSEDLRRVRMTVQCTQCNFIDALTRTKRAGDKDLELPKCRKCEGNIKVTESVDIIDELSTIGDQMGTQIEFISTDFEEGAQLLNAFGGIAAILRYKTGI
ncbi:MAG: peptide chain release factor aRF-1 [Methanosarcinales archaeon]|nr:peptide chain release factor aRF-1 [Methanosarcinales archaeon]